MENRRKNQKGCGEKFSPGFSATKIGGLFRQNLSGAATNFGGRGDSESAKVRHKDWRIRHVLWWILWRGAS